MKKYLENKLGIIIALIVSTTIPYMYYLTLDITIWNAWVRVIYGTILICCILNLIFENE